MDRRRAITVVAVVALLFAAVQLNEMAAYGRHPYSLYTTGRFVVCSAWVLVAVIAYERRFLVGVIAAAAIALLFNPFLLVHMSRNEWRPWDLAGMVACLLTAGVLGWALWREHRGSSPP
jgi:hypothetical protein